MPVAKSFYQVLTAAIADLTENGFDSQERLDRWLVELRAAARISLIPEEVLQRELRTNLTRVYERLVESGKLARIHKGVGQFTIANIKPSLRAELDRRILASANLIKLNRQASIERTLQRFAGWATSIPAGGSDVVERREVNETVRKSIAGLPFEERRVVIDQGHKLSSTLSDIVARDGGAIAAIWRHVREGGGYQARPDHEARNGEVFVIRGNWAMTDGLMKLAGAQYTDEVEAPGQLVFCRCTYSYLYNLRDLPPEMLTEKGRAELARVRAAG
jgi:hypothetical protein